MIVIKRFISLVLALILVFAFSVSSFATVTDVEIPILKSGWGSSSSNSYPSGYSSSWFYRVLYWLSQLKTEVTTIKTTTDNIYSAIDSVESYLVNYLGSSSLITTYLDKIRENSLTINSRLLDIYNKIPSSSDLSNIELALGAKTANNNSVLYCLNEIMSHTAGTIGEFYFQDPMTFEFKASSDFFASVGSNLFNMFNDLRQLTSYIADSSDQMTKAETRENQDKFTENFLSSASSNSVKVDDIGNLSSVNTSVKNTFSTGTSPSGVFDVLNSDSPWEWFTDDVANSLLADSGSSASIFSLRSAPVENVEVITSYYEDNLKDFYSWLDLVGDTE